MKKALASLLVLSMLLSMVPAVFAAPTGMTQAEAEEAVANLNANSDFYYELVDNYTDPDIEYQTEVRWWMAEGHHSDATLEEEIQAMYDAGFRGVELCQLNESSISAANYGYGSEQWNHDFHFILNKCLDLGMTVGMTSGTHWGTANVPGLDPDSQSANQCIVQNNETVPAGMSRTGALPLTNVRGKAKFLGAYAWPLAQASSQDSRYIQTTPQLEDLTTFTVDMDFIIDSDCFTFCFDAADTDHFIMWQINAEKNDQTRCRPHLRIAAWKGTTNYDVSNILGTVNGDLLGKKIHMKIEVKDGNTINTYFDNSETAAFTYTLDKNAANWKSTYGNFSLGKMGFRANSDHGNECEEISRVDNLTVKDGEGKVIYENTFDDPTNPGFAGPNLKVVDGMLRVGWDKVPADQVGKIDASRIIDLTDKVVLNEDGRTGTLDWTAPSDVSYTVMYYWQQGTANSYSPATKTSYTINYFDHRGLDALKEYWTANVLNDEALNAKIKAGDVQLFMDSLEYGNGKGFTMWPENFGEEFQARKGYDILPYIFLAIGQPSLWNWKDNDDITGTYNLTDADLTQRIRNDIYDVQTELYMEEFMLPFKQWLNSYGIKLRAQISYGKYLENSEPIQVVDFPEAENRNQGNEPDLYRTWTGGAHLQNKVLSSETGGLNSSAYAYSYQTHMNEAYIQYAVGFSRQIWHIWSTVYGPTKTWPGYEGGMSQFYKFGTREPSYTEYIEFNNHMGRVQQLLREGKAGVDVGMPYIQYGQPLSISSNKHALSHATMMFPSEELQNNGYSYDYFAPDFLTAEGVSYDAENGTLELAGYKAIVLWQDDMTADGAEALLNYAKQGLKIVVVDGAAVRTPYNDGSEEAMLATMEELKKQPSVTCVATSDDVLEALQAMGVVPYAGYSEPNQQLLGQVRRDGDNRYLYLYNYCGEQAHDGSDAPHGKTITTEIVMDGTFKPYEIDAWSGEIVPLAEYRHEDGKTVFEITLDYSDVALYAFEAVEEAELHIESTELDSYMADGELILPATESGETTVTLSDGAEETVSVEVPEAYDITGWDLTVESWTPGETVSRTEQLEGSSIVTTEYAVLTNKTNINAQLYKLTTWDKISEVGKAVSGKGTYTAKFNWDGTASGAYLDFGTMIESMQVFVNGQKTADVNMNAPIVDIGDLLVVGENTIELRYSSNLTNVQLNRGTIKAGTVIQSWAGSGYTINYRSYGPAQAVIVPYVDVSVHEPVTDVTLSLTGEDEAFSFDEEVTYTVSASGMVRLATAIISVQLDGTALTAPEALPAEGWFIIDQVWKNGKLTVALANLAGAQGEGDLMTITTKPTGEGGTCTVAVTGVTLSAYDGEGEVYVNAIYEDAQITTNVIFNACDVNRDGVVNQLDLTRAQRHFGTEHPDADVNDDGTVDIADLILILNNYHEDFQVTTE